MRVKRLCSLVIIGSSFLVNSCRTTSKSDTKDYLISCRDAQAKADAGAVLAGLINYAVDLVSFVPVVGQVKGMVDQALPPGYSPTEFVEGALTGDGCDSTAAKLDYFIKLTESRLSDLSDLIENNREGAAGRDAITLNSRIKAAAIRLDAAYDIIKDAKELKIDDSNVANARDSLIELSLAFGSLSDQIKSYNDITFMSLTFTGSVPAGLFSLIKGYGLIDEIKKKTKSDKLNEQLVFKQINEHVGRFYDSFNTYLFIAENKKRNYPGIEFFVKNIPPKASVTPGHDFACATVSDFNIRYNDEMLQYEVRVFGEVLAQKYKDFSTVDLALKLGQPYKTCSYVDDHPGYERAVSDAVRLALKAEYIDKVQALYDAITIDKLSALRQKLAWKPAPGLVATYYDGFSKDIAWGSPDRGLAFDDLAKLPTNKKIQVSKVEIRTGDRVDRVCFFIKDGPELCHGKTGGKPQSIDLEDGEYVNHVEVASKTLKKRPFFGAATNETRLFGIKIKTSKGKEILGGDWRDTAQWTFTPPLQPGGGQPAQIVGMHGGANKEVDSLGVIYSFSQGNP